MDEQGIAAQKLVELARPFLRENDRAGFAAALEGEWSADCLVLLLTSDDVEVVQAATIGLGLIGDMSLCPVLIDVLHHDDAGLASDAEDAMWSIWFRAAGPVAQGVLTRIAPLIHEEEIDSVVPLLTTLIKSFPGFAEAYHQRSQAQYLLGRYEAALRDAKRAVEMNPVHFGALASLANCLVALGRYEEALETYERVLALHPRMPDIGVAIDQLSHTLKTCRKKPAHLTLVTDSD